MDGCVREGGMDGEESVEEGVMDGWIQTPCLSPIYLDRPCPQHTCCNTLLRAISC